MNDPAVPDEPVLPAWSVYAGQVFNLTERRPLSRLVETDTAFVADGFYHRGQFWKALIPKRGVAAIIGQRLNFSKPRKHADGASTPSLFFLNHVQARVQMEPEAALLLYPLEVEPVGEPAFRIRDFCYSVEAVGPHGRRWNLSDALLGNLAIVHRFLSLEDVTFERVVHERRTVFQSPPLPLEMTLRNQVLHDAIRESHQAGLNRPYFMMRPPFSAANCTSEPLKLLDRVLRTPHWQRSLRRFPIHPRGYLKLRGMWSESEPVPTLNEEMAEWISSTDAQSRRQIHLEKKQRLPKPGADAKISWWKNLSRFPKALRSGDGSLPGTSESADART